MKGTRRHAALIITSLALAACSSDAPDARPSVPPPSASPAPATAPVTAAASTAAATTTTEMPLPAATFTVQPGTEQVAVLGATAGDVLNLLDNDGREIASGTVDAQGALLFRDVAAGDGYTIRSAAAQSAKFDVADRGEHPDDAFYANQPLLPAGGFGYVTVRDGTTLSANVVLPGPADQGPYPTVVEYSGYDPSNPGNATFAQIFTTMGFAYVGVNMRGSGCSGGSWRFFEEAQNLDGYDVIEAVAAQPWAANHMVGMVGISYPGISQLFVAQTRPPHLAAITPLSVIDDSYRATLYPGGILNTGFAVDWTRQRLADTAPYGEAWTKQRADGGDSRCASNQLLRLQNPDLIAEIDTTKYYSASLGDALAPITFVDKIDVPVFIAGAWQDEQTGGHFPAMLDHFTAAPHLYVTLVNGLHTESLTPAVFGRYAEFLQLYVARKVPSMQAANAVAPVLAKALYGVDQVERYDDRFAGMSYEQALAEFQAEPSVRVLLEQGGNPAFAPGTPEPLESVTYPAWPVSAARPQVWYLGEDGTLADTAPTVAGEATYTADPAALPATFYEGDSNAIWRAGTAYDWRPLPAGTGVGFVTQPLAGDVTIMGAGSVDLSIAASAADTDLEVTLSEVRPDGKEIYLQSGWLRASERKLDTAASTELRPVQTFLQADVQMLKPGEHVDVRVPLLPVAAPLRAGSRLRLTIDAPGNNRAVWSFRSISTGEQVTVAWGPTASRLLLPVVDGVALQAAPPACGSLRGQPCRDYVPATNGG